MKSKVKICVLNGIRILGIVLALVIIVPRVKTRIRDVRFEKEMKRIEDTVVPHTRGIREIEPIKTPKDTTDKERMSEIYDKYFK